MDFNQWWKRYPEGLTLPEQFVNMVGYIKELTENLKRKTDLYGDHKGSWQGLNRPTMSEEGMRAAVEYLYEEKIPLIDGMLERLVVDVEKLRITENIPNDDDLITLALTLIPNGGKILLSNRQYNFNRPIVIAPIVGDSDYALNNKYSITSNSKVELVYNGGGTFMEQGKTSWGTGNFAQGYIDIELENLVIQHRGSFSGSVGVSVKNVRKIKWKNVQVRGFEKNIYLLNVFNSANFEEVISWNASKENGSIGLHLDRGVNNFTHKNTAILGHRQGVLVSGVDTLSPLGHNFTNLFTNLDVEYCKYGIVIDPQNCNVASFKFLCCHFENNDYHAVVYTTNTVWNLEFDTCYFLNGDINIGAKTDLNEDDTMFEGTIYGGGFRNSFLDGGKLRVNDTLTNIVNFDTKGLNFYGTASDGIASGIVTSTLSTNQSQAIMPRYSNQPITPTRFDDKGYYGDIRWNDNSLFIRTQTSWKMVPLTKRNTMTANEKIKVSVKYTVPATQIAAWGFIDFQIPMSGVTFDSGWTIKGNPRKWLENGANFCCWISAENNVTLRIFSSGTVLNILEQDWYFIAERIED